MNQGPKRLLVGLLFACAAALYGQSNFVITSFHGSGQLSWNNLSNATEHATAYRVEWASSLQGPWTNSWDALGGIAATGQQYTVSVPMFYRVVATVTNAPSFSGDAYEPDNAFAQAKTITNGVAQVHSIHEVGDRDYVTLFCPGNSGGYCDIALGIVSNGADLVYHLYDETQTEIPDEGGFAAWMDLLEGVYYVMIEENGNDSVVPSYTLTVTTQPVPE